VTVIKQLMGNKDARVFDHWPEHQNPEEEKKLHAASLRAAFTAYQEVVKKNG